MGSGASWQQWLVGGGSCLLLIAGAWAQGCDYLELTPRPQWISSPPTSPTTYFGVGAQEVEELQPYEALRLAKQAALNDLSSNIELTLKGELASSLQVNGQGSSEQVSRQIQSVTRIVTTSTLKDIQVRETWLDRKSCTFWVLGAITRETVEALRNAERQRAKQQSLDSLLKKLSDTSLSLEMRQSELVTALALFDEINFVALGDEVSRSSYERRLAELSDKVGADYTQAREAQALLDEADRAASQARIAPTLKERALYGQAAANGYETVIGRFPFGKGKQFWAENASFRLADLYRTQNNSCRAVNYFERIRDSSNSNEWSSKAQEALAKVSCGAEERSASAWMNAVAGKEYGLVCLYRTNGTIKEWKNICDKMKEQIQKYGGVAKAVKLDKNRYAALFEPLKEGDVRTLEGNNHLAIAVADGELGSRKNKENPLGVDYQFKGAVATYVMSGSDTEFQDQFSGAGGWNPLSKEMAMEVLGVIVYNRWQEKYGAMVGAQ